MSGAFFLHKSIKLTQLKNFYILVPTNKRRLAMDRTALINCFQDTLHICNSPKLYLVTENAKNSTKVYKENFSSKNSYPCLKKDNTDMPENLAEIIVKEGTSFAIAKEYIKFGKTAVLNFANPHNAGGGVKNGAMAQEECLCRSSNLYPCLLTIEAQEQYYNYNKNNTDYFFSDRIIYSENITVFKNDNDIPVLMPEEDWFCVSIITCAAPYIAEAKYTNEIVLKELLKKRIKNIFEAALDNDIKILVLGAFGCGAFKNPPEVVAAAFHETIDENGYKKWFNKIIFAIKSTMNNIENNTSYKACPNITAFESEFYGISKEARELAQSTELLSGRLLNGKKEISVYSEWGGKNKYKGKQFSILGDSISTLEGFNPHGYKVFYKDEICDKSGVKEMKNTWWGKIINFFGGELLVNNSWSGSRVTKLPDSSSLFPSGCSDERTSRLHINNVKPDIVIIYLGTNDWCFGAVMEKNKHKKKGNLEYFDTAYYKMLKNVKTNYPNAEIWCCTLNSTFMSNNPSFVFPEIYNGNNINDYNKIIHDIVIEQKCKLIDLYSVKIPYDSIDATHPNINGMNILAQNIIRCVDKFGREEWKNRDTSSLEEDKFDYVILDENITRILYNGRISLYIKSKDKKLSLEGTRFTLGRDNDCDIVFDDNMISWLHAVFYLEGFTWYVADFSENGIWLNGNRLKPKTKYELFADDLIDIAGKEKIIFYKTSGRSLVNSGFNNCTQIFERPKAGKIINNKYEILKQISESAFTRIYLTQNLNLNTFYLLKICCKSKIGSLNFLMQETDMVKNLNHHMIPKIIDIVDDNEYFGIIEEYFEGENLGNVIRKYGPQPLENVVSWARQICDVLQYLHTLDPPRIHRDIKPQNIILQADGHVKLIDFGTMIIYGSNQSRDGVIGTRGYAPPEQYCGETDARTDIFALGMTMYYLLTGIDPAKNYGVPAGIRQMNSNFSSRLEKIINRCIELNPTNRFQSCLELSKALNGVDTSKKKILSKILKKIMNELFINILEVTDENKYMKVSELVNEKLDKNKNIFKYNGFEFELLSPENNNFIQISIYAYNNCITRLLGCSVETQGLWYDVKLDTPILIEADDDGGFAGNIYCGYIFQISRRHIQPEEVYRLMEIDEPIKKGHFGRISVENYLKIRERFCCSEK